MADLYEKSGGELLGLSRERFAAILEEIGAKYLPAGTAERDAASLYASLRVEELALARACAAGHERAWEIFLLRYREKLYDIAGYIAKEASAARELADSLDSLGTQAALKENEGQPSPGRHVQRVTPACLLQQPPRVRQPPLPLIR